MPLDGERSAIQKKSLYFDWAATAVPDEDILRAALEESLDAWANPSSGHSAGKKAKNALENARQKCAACLNAKAQNIFFTSGGTESSGIVLSALLNKAAGGSVLVSSIEHPSVREMAMSLARIGISVRQIPAATNGIITAEAVKNALTDDTLCVCVMAVNNETGAIQPISEIADTITDFYKGRRRAKFHVDAVQAAGKIPIDIAREGIDSAAFSAHKISGPRGIGILYLASANSIEPFLRGGGQEGNIRSGTENLFGAVAFAKCLERYAIADGTEAFARFEQQKEWTKNFVERLHSIGGEIIPRARLESPDDYSPWIVQAAFKGIPGNVMLRALDANGVAISTGSACSSKKNSRPVLEAMGLSNEARENAVRFSFGHSTARGDMDRLFDEVKKVCEMFSRG